MMRFLLFVLMITFAYSDTDLENFSTRQDILQKIKQVILDEESIANAYEQYILNTYSTPDNLGKLKTIAYLGENFGSVDGTYFNNFTLPNTKKLALNYALGEDLSKDSHLKSIYESDSFRKKTYVYEGNVYFKLQDDFAKNLFVLIKTQNAGLIQCADAPKRQYCTKNNHIYLYTDSSQSEIIMYYYKDKFQTGPIIISKDTSLYSTKDEFKNLPLSIIMYDLDGVKYLKTSSSIEKVK